LDPSDRDRTRTLASARAAAAILGVLAFLPLLLSLVASPVPRGTALVVPAGAIGILAPALAWRLQAQIRERAGGSAAGARRAYLRSVVVGLAITAAAALFGGIVWLLSRETAALAGLLMHVLLVGAIWPTEARLEHAEEEAAR
jgi:hypothetical protein